MAGNRVFLIAKCVAIGFVRVEEARNKLVLYGPRLAYKFVHTQKVRSCQANSTRISLCASEFSHSLCVSLNAFAMRASPACQASLPKQTNQPLPMPNSFFLCLFTYPRNRKNIQRNNNIFTWNFSNSDRDSRDEINRSGKTRKSECLQANSRVSVYFCTYYSSLTLSELSWQNWFITIAININITITIIVINIKLNISTNARIALIKANSLNVQATLMNVYPHWNFAWRRPTTLTAATTCCEWPPDFSLINVMTTNIWL